MEGMERKSKIIDTELDYYLDRVGLATVMLPDPPHHMDIEIVKTLSHLDTNTILPILPNQPYQVLKQSQEDTFEIDGIKYRKKNMLVSAFTINEKTDEEPDVNIVAEYELIIKKLSKLTKSKRDRIIRQFERNYERC
jgi:hypothetical protein